MQPTPLARILSSWLGGFCGLLQVYLRAVRGLVFPRFVFVPQGQALMQMLDALIVSRIVTFGNPCRA